ncbi:MAG: DNA repair protein RecN [Vampirovibrionales bacterium]|nr:DNA repair protein RecN [Vampirovibrionales bacterium]
MLKSLTLENIAIIDRAAVDFESGMTVITGETGSGKSLLLDGIALAFGNKVSPKDILRQGACRAQIELGFSLSQKLFEKPALIGLLEEAGIEYDAKEESEFLISREFSAKGSRSRINGIPVAREVVEKLRPFCLDLHGQHELTNLFECDNQREYLDSLGNTAFQALKKEVSELYQHYSKILSQLEKLRSKEDQWLRQRDFLKFQCDELDELNVVDTEEDVRLQAERERLTFYDQIKNASEEAAYLLSSDSLILENLQTVQKRLGAIAAHDEKLAGFSENATGLYEEIRQLGNLLSDYASRLDEKPANIEDVLLRLEALERAKRKYGPTLEALMQTHQNLSEELRQMQALESDQESLLASLDHVQNSLSDKADLLSLERKKLAQRLETALLSELKQLSLPSVGFAVMIEKTAFSASGQDHLSFLFSANPGEPLRPLAKVASGGELSRVLLALKVITAASEGAETLVFDEIDTGISGATAKRVSEKLSALSKTAQVIVITHQPVIAAVGDQHWQVEKRLFRDSVEVKIKRLSHETDRLAALSHMIDGTASALELAAQLRQGYLHAPR